MFSNGSLGGDAEVGGSELSNYFNNSTGSYGGDSVYSFTTSKTLNLRASSSGHAVYLRSADCQSGPELARGYWSGIEVVGLAAGTY